jgi:WD40 repeat protein
MPDPQPGDYRYWAFISYSSKDQGWARWLHRQLEGYKIPGRLVGQKNTSGTPAPKRLKPVFRDRDELPASADLGEQLERALIESRFLIVICSPNSAHSQWVDKEIESFIRQGREQCILALIIDGEPNAGGDLECFPPHLRSVEPIAADARKAADGKLNAMLKLVAGMLGVGFDALKQRDALRRTRRLRIALALALSLAGVLAGLGLYANAQRIEAETARKEAVRQEVESKRRLARSYVEKAWSRFDDGNNADALLWHVEALRVLTTSPSPPARATERNYRARIARVAAHAAPPPRLILAPDGEPRLALATPSHDRILLRGADWAQLYRYRDGRPIGAPIALVAEETVRFAANEGLLLASSGRAWQLTSGAPAQAEPPGPGAFSAHAGNDGTALIPWRAGATTLESADGRVIVRRNNMKLEIGGAAGKVRTIDTEQGRMSDSMMGFLPNTFLALSPDQRFLVASFAARHRFLGGQVWDLHSLRKVGEFFHPKGFTSIGFSADSRQFATAGDDATVRMWSMSAVEQGWMQEIAAPLRHGDRVISAAFVGDGDELLTVSADGGVRLWPVEPYAALFRSSSQVAPDLATEAVMEAVPLLGVTDNEQLLESVKAETGDRSFTFAVVSPAGDKVVFSRKFGFAASPDAPSNKAQVWSIDVGNARLQRLLYEIEHPDSISAVGFAADGRWLATGSSNGEARVWDAANGEAVSPILAASQEVTVLAPLPAQGRLVAASRDNRVRVWDVHDGQMIVPPLAFEAELQKLSITADSIRVDSEYLGRGGTIDYLAGGPDRPVNRPTRDDRQRGPALKRFSFGEQLTATWRLPVAQADIEDLVTRSRRVSSQKVDRFGSEQMLSAKALQALSD